MGQVRQSHLVSSPKKLLVSPAFPVKCLVACDLQHIQCIVIDRAIETDFMTAKSTFIRRTMPLRHISRRVLWDEDPDLAITDNQGPTPSIGGTEYYLSSNSNNITYL